MYIKMPIKRYTKNCSNDIIRLKDALDTADKVLIGAGAGLSASAGFDYSGERFKKYFGDFIDKYGFTDMYTAGFYPFETPEEKWAYWSRYIMINRYMEAPKDVYGELLEFVKDKDYFVITTNVDHCFQKAGFDKQRLFYTQGDYGLFQCSEPCCQKTYDNEKVIREMFATQRDMEIHLGLVPYCPNCGKPMSMNLRADHTFVEDEGWHDAALRYSDFVKNIDDKKLLLLELGVGANTPGIIKYPFWKIAYQNENATYACINVNDTPCPPEIIERSICIRDDIEGALKKIREN